MITKSEWTDEELIMIMLAALRCGSVSLEGSDFLNFNVQNAVNGCLPPGSYFDPRELFLLSCNAVSRFKDERRAKDFKII